jgi:adenine deaminase
MIASVHPRGSRADAHQRHALDGAYLSPGLMDTHVHLESSHLPPERYAEIVLAQGTTAVFWDPHELANVLGVEGVRYAVAASRHLPLQVMVAAPSSVPRRRGWKCPAPILPARRWRPCWHGRKCAAWRK